MDQNTKPVPSVRAALKAIVDAIEAIPSAPMSSVLALNGLVDEAKAALAAPFGLTVEQESKYTTCPHTGAIISRATGRPIPPDEPIMIFRAQDVHAREVTRRYSDLVRDNSATHTSHGNVCFERYQRFVAFAEDHPERMKKPD